MDLSYFASLPEENLEQICEGMDAATLTKFVEGYSRAYHICKKVYDRKKKAYETRRASQTPDLFGNMSNDTMRTLCSSMDNQTLRNTAVSSARVRTVCSNILAARGINL